MTGPELFLGSDHAGFKAKENLKKFLQKKNFHYIDLGPHKYKKNDDYPEYAFKVSEQVAANSEAKGILICGSGTGISIAANKVKGIRAAAAYDLSSAKISRLDNDANILALNGRTFSSQKIQKIVITWLSTNFSNKKRHMRRIRKIHAYETKNE